MTTPALGEHRPAGGRRLQSFGIIAGAHAEHVARDVAHATDVGDVRSRAYDPKTIAPARSRPDVLVSLQPALSGAGSEHSCFGAAKDRCHPPANLRLIRLKIFAHAASMVAPAARNVGRMLLSRRGISASVAT